MELYGLANAVELHPMSYGCAYMGYVVIVEAISYVAIKEGDFCLTMSDALHYINGLWFLYLSKTVLVVIAMLHYSLMGTYIIL